MSAAEAKARELGAVDVVGGINWTWANEFPDHAKSMQFIQWLEANGYEHRGSYPNGAPDYSWSVRYR